MQIYGNLDIQEIPLASPYFRKEVEWFLEANGLRIESLDSYYAVRDQDGSIVAGAGIENEVIKCVAVAPKFRSEGLVAPLISYIISLKGGRNLKVFTKPEHKAVFESLGFKLIGQASKAILLENGRGLKKYVSYLEGSRKKGSGAVIVMNANPFHNGHLHLLNKALSIADNVYVIVVREDRSVFPYTERLEMVRRGICNPRVAVLEGSDYQISAATFPSYFLKREDDATAVQMELDLDIFCRHIAPSLGADIRVAGSEESDPFTAKYNMMMARVLPEHGVRLFEVPRLISDNKVLCATQIRSAGFNKARELTPASSWPYILAHLAQKALLDELETPLKPGLVCPESSGAHSDMDYALMLKAIKALRPFWSSMACASTAEKLRQEGIDAEKVMLDATGGVNTHRGAIFCIGLVLNVCGRYTTVTESLMRKRLPEIAEGILHNSPEDSDLAPRKNTRGAMDMALGGYKELFESWLPYYRAGNGNSKTLLKIMSTLDDTCIVNRVGEHRACEVKMEAKELLENYSKEKLEQMCEQYAREGISPGGAADMLALTILMNWILN